LTGAPPANVQWVHITAVGCLVKVLCFAHAHTTVTTRALGRLTASTSKTSYRQLQHNVLYGVLLMY